MREGISDKQKSFTLPRYMDLTIANWILNLPFRLNLLGVRYLLLL